MADLPRCTGYHRLHRERGGQRVRVQPPRARWSIIHVFDVGTSVRPHLYCGTHARGFLAANVRAGRRGAVWVIADLTRV